MQLSGKWIWILTGLTSASCNEMNVGNEEGFEFDTFEDCFRHFYTWYNTPKF